MAVRVAAAARCARFPSQPDERHRDGEARWRCLSGRRRWCT